VRRLLCPHRGRRQNLGDLLGVSRPEWHVVAPGMVDGDPLDCVAHRLAFGRRGDSRSVLSTLVGDLSCIGRTFRCNFGIRHARRIGSLLSIARTNPFGAWNESVSDERG